MDEAAQDWTAIPRLLLRAVHNKLIELLRRSQNISAGEGESEGRRCQVDASQATALEPSRPLPLPETSVAAHSQHIHTHVSEPPISIQILQQYGYTV